VITAKSVFHESDGTLVAKAESHLAGLTGRVVKRRCSHFCVRRKPTSRGHAWLSLKLN